MASHHTRNQVPNDIDTSNQTIPAQNLKSQTYLNKIKIWTEKQKMELNERKKIYGVKFYKEKIILNPFKSKWKSCGKC